MALYFLEYDLRKQRDYAKLTDELRNFNAIRILKSLWCFTRLNTTTSALRDYFRQFIDADDGLIVAQVTDWATFNAEGTPYQP